MSNLRLINETTATSVSSLTVDNIFSADFDIYKMTIDNDNTTNNVMKMRLVNSSGSIISASSYDYANLELNASASFGEDKNTNFNEFRGLYEALEGNSAVVYFFNPFSSSSYTFRLHQAQSFYTTNYPRGGKGIGVLKQTSSITGINIFQTGSAFSYLNIKTYGLRVDS